MSDTEQKLHDTLTPSDVDAIERRLNEPGAAWFHDGTFDEVWGFTLKVDMPALIAEVRRLREMQKGLAAYLKPYNVGHGLDKNASLWPDTDTILCDFVDEEVWEEVFEPCAICEWPKDSYKHREDHFFKAKDNIGSVPNER